MLRSLLAGQSVVHSAKEQIKRIKNEKSNKIKDSEDKISSKQTKSHTLRGVISIDTMPRNTRSERLNQTVYKQTNKQTSLESKN